MQEIINNDNLKIKSASIGMLGNNVYVIQSDGEKAIVDPSCNPDEIIELAGGIDVDKILITHYHWDHVRAGAKIKQLTNAKTYASAIDAPFIEDPEKAPLYRKTEPFPIDVKLSENDTINIGSSFWKVIETPGHTPGCICFYCDNCGDKPILICGDTLFKCSCGRTDFADSNELAMRNSLAKLAKLPDNTIVLPGHEGITTIANERNFMLRGL